MSDHYLHDIWPVSCSSAVPVSTAAGNKHPLCHTISETREFFLQRHSSVADHVYFVLTSARESDAFLAVAGTRRHARPKQATGLSAPSARRPGRASPCWVAVSVKDLFQPEDLPTTIAAQLYAGLDGLIAGTAAQGAYAS
jgi:hypothetical protein